MHWVLSIKPGFSSLLPSHPLLTDDLFCQTPGSPRAWKMLLDKALNGFWLAPSAATLGSLSVLQGHSPNELGKRD